MQSGRVRRADRAGFADVEIGAAALLKHGHLLSTLTLPSGARIVCGTFVSRYDDGDTLELDLPLGALARVDRRYAAVLTPVAGALEYLPANR